jgi:hypothetical protein
MKSVLRKHALNPVVNCLARPYLPFPSKEAATKFTVAGSLIAAEELSQFIQKYQYGLHPAKPDKVTGVLKGNTLNVKVDYQGRSINYNVTITRPEGDGPFPAMVLISAMMPGINARNLSPRGVATEFFDDNPTVPTISWKAPQSK